MEQQHNNVKYTVDEKLINALKHYHGIDPHKEIKKAIDQCTELSERIKSENKSS